ncbi:MAG: aminopeptidase [Methanomassiliicoccales archaeon]|nr:MAG: aminopeptidase [Methanomassiliicoccales archaeon]
MTLAKGAKVAVEVCMGVKKGEEVLIISDSTRDRIAEALFQASLDMGAEPILVKIQPRTRHGEEPPKSLAIMMMEADVVFAPTEYSMTHTQARRNATREGARIATMPGITEGMMDSGAMLADFHEIQRRMRRVYRKLRGAREVSIESELGTDFTLSVKGRDWITDDVGICHRKGQYTNLPAGEIFIAPREGTANGKLVIDGSFVGAMEEPARVSVKDGYATRIVGAKEAVQELNKGGKEGRNVAELGIGLNDKARIIGNVLEDEKALGTAHVAFGDNSTFGGKVRCGVHIDGVMKNPTLVVDELVVLEDGEMKI